MKLITVGTGSEQGNCYLIKSNGRFTALDAGCKWKDVLVATGFSVFAIEACFVSHMHQDHLEQVHTFKRCGVPIYTNEETASKIGLNWYGGTPKPNTRNRFYSNNWFIPFDVPHTNTDGSDCRNYAYILCIDGERILYMTDWMYCPYNLRKFNINHFLIAINYTDYPDDERSQHVLRGHASLDTATEFLKTSMTDACRSITGCHLSDKNADEKLILSRLKELAGENVTVNIAHKGETIDL